MIPRFGYYYDPFQKSGNEDRGERLRRTLWFASQGKAEKIVYEETGVILSSDQTPELLALLTYNAMESCIGFNSGRHLDRPGLRRLYDPVVRVNSFSFWPGEWISEVLNLPFTAKEMGGRLQEASHHLEQGVNFAWDPKDERLKRFKLYGYGDIFAASDCFAQGMAAVYRGVLEASVQRLKTTGGEGAAKLELDLKQSKLGDEFAQTVSKDREALVENPQLARNYGTGTGSAPAVKVLADHTLLAAAAVIPECALTAFTVQCGHGKRGYILDVLGGKPTNGTRHLLQVISEQDKFDEVTVNFTGSCGHGKKGCPAIQVNSGGETWNSPHKFKVKYKTTQVTDRFGLFVKRFLAPDLDALVPEEYIISTRSCTAPSHRAVVQSFPPFKSWGKISFGYDVKKAKTATRKTGTFLDDWFLEGDLGYYVGDSTWQYKKGGTIADYFPKLGNAVAAVVGQVDDLISEAKEKKEKRKIITTEIKSNVSLGANVELMETKGAHDVDFGGKIAFKFDPLLGIDVKIDILQVLIDRLTGISPFLNMVREKAEKGFGGKKVSTSLIVELDLIISGTMAIELSWKKNPHEKWLSTKGDKTAKRKWAVTISLEGKVKSETKIFYVKITVGAGFEVKSARNKSEGVGGAIELFATTEKGKPTVGGELIFTGATIYYMYYAEVSVEENQNKKRQKRGRAGSSESADARKTYTRREEKSGSHDLLEPRTWPDWKNENDKKQGVEIGKLDI